MIRAAGDLDPHSSYSTLYEKFRKNGNDEIENFYEILSVILGYYTGPIEKQDIKKNHKNFNKFVQKLNEMENTKNSNFLEKKIQIPFMKTCLFSSELKSFKKLCYIMNGAIHTQFTQLNLTFSNLTQHNSCKNSIKVFPINSYKNCHNLCIHNTFK